MAAVGSVLSQLVAARRRRTCPRATIAPAVALAVAALLGLATEVGGQIRYFRAEETIDARALLERVAEGEDILLQDTAITGHLDLTQLDAVAGSIRCRRCIFEDRIDATDVEFARVVDFSGTKFRGPVDFTAASFHDTTLFRSSADEVTTTFEKNADFSLARFDEPTIFDDVEFKRDALFIGTTFTGDASFAETDFGRRSLFGLSKFGGTALFSGTVIPAEVAPTPMSPCGTNRGAFRGVARFARAFFAGRADFRQRCFADVASFERATFQDEADFSLATFAAPTTFDRARFGRDATFINALATEPLSATEVRAGSLSFFAAEVREVDLTRAVVTGMLSLETAVVTGVLSLKDVQATGLALDLDDVEHLSSDTSRRRILRILASSAEAAGELPLAMKAEFLVEEAKTDESSGEWRWMRHHYGAFMGYLVQPANPLATLAFLVLYGIAARFITGEARSQATPLRRGARAIRDTLAERGQQDPSGR